LSGYQDLTVHPKAKRSGIRMVNSWTLFVSGFQMVKTKWQIPFESQTGYFLTSLDGFGMNKIFFMALFI
jgi:hypothetical protein